MFRKGGFPLSMCSKLRFSAPILKILPIDALGTSRREASYSTDDISINHPAWRHSPIGQAGPDTLS